MNDVLEGVSTAQLMEYLDEIDGHDIFRAEYFTDMGFDPEWIKKMVIQFVEDPEDSKKTVYNSNGRPVEHGVGIPSINFIENLAQALQIHAEAWRAEGRGKRARDLANAVKQFLTLKQE